jgi:hypothetical protein
MIAVETAPAETVLVDFGNNGSFRGVSVVGPDLNGHHWNSLLPGSPALNLVNSGNIATTIDIGFSTPVGTDSYNGPAGPTTGPTPSEIAATDIDAVALGNLGVTNAAIDFAAGAPGAVRFEIQQLNPAKTYDLTLYGSHKFNTDATTVYSVYTDDTYSTVVDSVSVDVHQSGSPWLHNRDTVVTITNLSPQTGDILYFEFIGLGGDAGYLNAMEITVHNAGTNNPPVATNLATTVFEGGGVEVSVTEVAADPDGDTLSFSSVGVPNGTDYGTAAIAGGGATLTYTNTGGSPGDVDVFSFVMSDGNGGSATNELSVQILSATEVILLSATHDGTFAYLTYSAPPGDDYALDWTDSLATPFQWQEVQVQTPDAGGLLRYTNPLALPPTNSFFRVRSLVSSPARGAALPYVTREAEDGSRGGGATLLGPSMDETRTESEASGRQYVELDQTGEYVEWTVQHPADAFVMRFTMPDAPTGGGTSATLGLYVNGSRVSSLDLTSKWAWQYFPNPPGAMEPSNDPTVHPRPRMRFDDHRHILASSVGPGDVIRLQKDVQDTSTYGIDLIELEPIPAAIPAPANSLDVTTYGAVPDDAGDDWSAFNSCEADARTQGKTMYIPPGRFHLGQRWGLYSVDVQGAGVWHTEVHFTNPDDCGVQGESSIGSVVTMRDLYMTTETTTRNSEHGIAGYYAPGSLFSNVWSTHFVVGAWIAEYASGQHLIPDGLTLSGCRFRNTYADGLNFAKGSRNCVVENTHFRNNGDDAMASWSSNVGQVPEAMNNTFRFNTVENTWRAAGLGIFGGRGHVAHDCVFRDITGQAGIRFNTVFPGHPFSTNTAMVVSNMTLVRVTGVDLWGNDLGAVTFQTVNSPVHHIELSHLEVLESKHHGVYYGTANGHPVNNVYFDTMTIADSGEYGIHVENQGLGWSENSYVTITNSGTAAVYDFSPFDLRKIIGNVGW